MTVQEALKQARQALYVVEDEQDRGADYSKAVLLALIEFRLLVEAVEEREPHIIDSRRLAALELVNPSPVSLTVAHLRRPGWWVSLGETVVGAGSTAAEALADAEREARP